MSFDEAAPPLSSARRADPMEQHQYDERCIDEKALRLFDREAESVRKLLKRPVTIRLDAATVDYFKELAAEADLQYQTLINLYLRDCAASERRLDLRWRRCKSGAV